MNLVFTQSVSCPGCTFYPGSQFYTIEDETFARNLIAAGFAYEVDDEGNPIESRQERQEQCEQRELECAAFAVPEQATLPRKAKKAKK